MDATMRPVDLKLGNVQFSAPQRYKLLFEGGAETSVAPLGTTPVFEERNIQAMCLTDGTFTLTVLGLEGGEQVLATQKVRLPYSEADFEPFSVNFSAGGAEAGAGGAGSGGLTGSVQFRYRHVRKPLVGCLKGDRVCCLSLQAAHLNTLLEQPFSLRLSVRVGGKTLGSAELTNDDPNAHIDLEGEGQGEGRMEVLITDGGRIYRASVGANSPAVVAVPTGQGDPVVITMQCVAWTEAPMGNTSAKVTSQSDTAKHVTATVHSCALREASIARTPGSSARRISFTPRRTTSIDHTALKAGVLGLRAGQVIPSTKKTLLFLEDMVLNPTSTLSSRVVGGVQGAVEVDLAGRVVGTPILNEHTEYLKDSTTADTTGVGAGVGAGVGEEFPGPLGGAYILCASKSEVLEGGSVRKVHKKQSLALNLGIIQTFPDTLTGPVKIRASLLDLHFSGEPGNPDAADNPEGTGQGGGTGGSGKGTGVQVRQRAVIAYLGLLEETSRELFNDTGLISVTLEGKLFKPQPLSPRVEEEERCVAVKLYASLVPSRVEVEEESIGGSASELSLNLEHSVSGSEVGAVGAGAGEVRGVGDKKGEGKGVGEGEGGEGERIGVGDDNLLDQEILERKLSAAQQAAHAAQTLRTPYNIVTDKTAFPGELQGSSALNVPTQKLSERELKLLPKSQKGYLVPKLDLGGSPSKSKSQFQSLSQSQSQASSSDDLGREGRVGGGGGVSGGFGEGVNALALSKGSRLQALTDHNPHHAAATGVAFASLVREQLEQKQREVESLNEEVRVRNEAVQICGLDIRALREEKIRLLTQIDSMEREKKDKEGEVLKADRMTADILKYPHLLQGMEKSALVQNMHALVERVGGLERDRGALQGALLEAKEVVGRFASTRTELGVLQEAHQAQSRYLLKMQGRIRQAEEYKSTIQTQETIISKMQSIIEAKMRSKNGLPNPKLPHIKPVPVIPDLVPDLKPEVKVPDFLEIVEQKRRQAEAEAELERRVEERVRGQMKEQCEAVMSEAREESEELRERVGELESQLLEAKLAQYQDKSGSRDSRGDSRGSGGSGEDSRGSVEMESES
ncbi:hypothetical protein B484DRAFT_482688, partial [Ochromonadaceae sp. CCMP2298]